MFIMVLKLTSKAYIASVVQVFRFHTYGMEGPVLYTLADVLPIPLTAIIRASELHLM